MELKETALVSIILPTYNGEKYITQAIESVIAQTYQQWELIVINDGSSDSTESAVAHFSHDTRIVYIKNEKNLGIQKSLNRGLARAQGVFIARIDDDDVWCDAQKIARQVNFLTLNPDHVLVGTGVIMIDENNEELIRYLLPSADADIRLKLLGKNCFVHSSVMFKKDIVSNIGGYSESKSVLHVEDYDLWLALGLHGRFANIPIYAVMFKLRKGSLSFVNKFDQAKKTFHLAYKYRKQYSGYIMAVVRSAVRLVVYGVILQLPIKLFINRLAKWYKENW